MLSQPRGAVNSTKTSDAELPIFLKTFRQKKIKIKKKSIHLVYRKPVAEVKDKLFKESSLVLGIQQERAGS